MRYYYIYERKAGKWFNPAVNGNYAAKTWKTKRLAIDRAFKEGYKLKLPENDSLAVDRIEVHEIDTDSRQDQVVYKAARYPAHTR
jgi:hypothetical protein